MNKGIVAILSFGLVAVSFFTMGTGQNAAIKAGAGKGTDKQITTKENLQEVLDFVAQRKSSDGVEAVATTVKNGGVVATNELNSKTGVTSLTAVENAELSISVVNRGERTEVVIDRSLTAYFTETASYYSSEGTLITSEEDSKTVWCFDINYYFKEECFWVQFNEFSLWESYEDTSQSKQSSGVIIKPSNRGVWIETPWEFTQALIAVNEYNVDGLATLKKYLENAEGHGNIYTYKDETADYNYECTFDLSNKKTPCMEAIETSEVRIDDGGYVVKVSTASYARMEVFNINNTVIDNNIKANYVCEDLESFNDLFHTFE